MAPMALSSPVVVTVTLLAVSVPGTPVTLLALSAAELGPVVAMVLSLTMMLPPSRALMPRATEGVVVLTRLLLSVRVEPTPSTCTAGEKGPLVPIFDTLLLVICAVPPALMATPKVRLAETVIAVSATWACDPAPSTDSPVPRTPVVVIVLPAPLITTLPPLNARTPAFGELSLLLAPVLVIELLVNATVPPASASAPEASVADVLTVTPVASI
ncbi:hypothetical protein D3C76_73300 [compost metagenome]